MNTKKYAGIGLIVLGGIGMEEGVRRAVINFKAGDLAYDARMEALEQAKVLSDAKNSVVNQLNIARGKVETCDLISEDDGKVLYCPELSGWCSGQRQEHRLLEGEVTYLQTDYNSAMQRSEQLQKKYKDDFNWFCGDITLALFSLVLTASGLVYLRRKEEHQEKQAAENKPEEKKE